MSTPILPPSTTPVSMGQTDYVVQGQSYTLDPKSGRTAFFTAEGNESRLLQVGYQLEAEGLRVQINPISGTPQYRLTATFPDLNDGEEQIPTVKWALKTQIEDVDIFQLPRALVEMEAFAELEVQPISKYRKLITEAVSKGNAFPSEIDGDLYPFAVSLYRMLSEGTRSFPKTRSTLYRTRIMGWDYANPVVVTEEPYVYTTAALIRDYGIPSSIANRLPNPSNAALPSTRHYGWLLMNQDTDDEQSRYFRQEEVISWTFAPFDIEIYSFIT
jgi:hypothetical protein